MQDQSCLTTGDLPAIRENTSRITDKKHTRHHSGDSCTDSTKTKKSPAFNGFVASTSHLEEIISLQARQIAALQREVAEKDAELRSVYNTVVGRILKIYKTFRKKIRHRKREKRHNYHAWLNAYDTLTRNKRIRVLDRIDEMEYQPIISVVTSADPHQLRLLEESLESLKKQLYRNWELFITCNDPQNIHLNALVDRYRAKNLSIATVSGDGNNPEEQAPENLAINAATGKYITFLSPTVRLHPLAFFYVAEEINRHPESELIYSDEDKLDNTGNRTDPHFKCDFNYDLFLCQNMIGSASVYSVKLLRQIGGFRKAFEGAEVYDIALRSIERLKPENIRHIPRVLYHTRSQVKKNEQTLGMRCAEIRAVKSHLERMHINASVHNAPEAEQFRRIRYTLPVTSPSVDIIIPTRNNIRLLQKCILSILSRTTYDHYRITIIDNGSTESECLELLNQWEANARITIIRDPSPFNYSKLNNRAVNLSSAEFVCLMNNDIEIISPEWLDEMMSHAIQPNIGAVGARLWYPDYTLQHGGVIVGLHGGACHSHKHLPKGNSGYFGRASLQQSFSAVTAACMLLHRSHFLAVGGLNEEHLPIAFNDVDLCLKLREKGLRNVWTPYAEMFHHESASRGHDDTPEKQEQAKKEVRYIQNRWKNMIRHDPAYSPNLTIEYKDFSIAWPPRTVELYSEHNSNILPLTTESQ